MKKIDMRCNRIPKELAQIKKSSKNNGITCELKNESDFSQLKAIIPGPKNSPYENGKFILNIELTEQYPFRPPLIKFLTPIFHPNIDNAGTICLDVLQIPPNGSYCPAFTLESILISIQLLLTTPNPEDPLSADIADLYKYNKEEFIKKAREYTKNHAILDPEVTECEPKKLRTE